MLSEADLIDNIASIKKYAKKLTKDYEDLTQDTLVKAWSQRHLYDQNKGKAKVWLLSITHNLYVATLYEGGYGAGRNKILKKPFVDIDSIDTKKTIMPNQEHLIAFKQAQKLPNFDLSLANALGYSLEDIMEQLDAGQGISIKRSSLYEHIQKFRNHKEEYV